MTRRKVFFVVSWMGRGGTERHVLDLVWSSHPDHADCTVVCLSDQAGELADEVVATGARLVVLGIRREHFARGMVTLARILRRERPDAVYALGFHQYCVALPIARVLLPSAARLAGRQHLPEFDISPLPGSRRLRFVADAVSDLVIGNSQAVRDAWLSENPRLEGRLLVVPNGLRLIDSRPEERSVDGRLRITYTARLVDWKGHRVLVDALKKLEDRDDWRADFVGGGPEHDALERQVADLGLAGRITLRGSLPPEQVHAVVSASDLFALPSFGEGMPNAMMEAMAYGVPCVATNVAGVRELLGTGAGLIVPPRDADAMAGAIARMLDDPGLRRSAGAEGERLIHERHTVDGMRDATLAAVERAIGSQ